MQTEKNEISMIEPCRLLISKSRMWVMTSERDRQRNNWGGKTHEGLLLGIQEYSSRRGRCTTRKALRSKKKETLQRFIGFGHW